MLGPWWLAVGRRRLGAMAGGVGADAAVAGAAVAGLTVIDMIKAVTKEAVLTDVRMESKEGGKSGVFMRGSAGTGQSGLTGAAAGGRDAG